VSSILILTNFNLMLVNVMDLHFATWFSNSLIFEVMFECLYRTSNEILIVGISESSKQLPILECKKVRIENKAVLIFV
jgi:hypothetical protein